MHVLTCEKFPPATRWVGLSEWCALTADPQLDESHIIPSTPESFLDRWDIAGQEVQAASSQGSFPGEGLATLTNPP